jgi:hypothetical protein
MINDKEIADLKNKVDKVESAVIEVEKDVVKIGTILEERDKILNEKLDKLDNKTDEHIKIHVRREEAVLAAAQAKANGLQKKAEKEKQSIKEKLFYPLIILLVSGILGFVLSK